MGTKDPRDSLTRWGDECVDLAVRRGRDALKEKRCIKIGSEVAQLSGIRALGSRLRQYPISGQFTQVALFGYLGY